MTEPEGLHALAIGVVGDSVAIAVYDAVTRELIGGIKISPEQAYEAAQKLTLSGMKAEDRKKNRT